MLAAAIAGQTSRIRLGSAVTVLTTDDPVRVFQRYSTLNAVSNGRAEIIIGRGSFTESFPLFGFDLGQYNALFEERLELFAALLTEQPVTWSGQTRSALRDQHVFPPTDGGLRAWVGVGGSPDSVIRAARHGLPLMLAIIGGNPGRFAPWVELYHRALTQLDKPLLPVGAHCPGHLAPTDEQAREQLWPHYAAMVGRIGAERGWPPPTRARFDVECGPEGAICAGAPESVARKIVHVVRTLGLSRFDMKYSNGTLPHDTLMRSIELYATEVVPRVKALLAQDA